jgi:hypothetical protein
LKKQSLAAKKTPAKAAAKKVVKTATVKAAPKKSAAPSKAPVKKASGPIKAAPKKDLKAAAKGSTGKTAPIKSVSLAKVANKAASTPTLAKSPLKADAKSTKSSAPAEKPHAKIDLKKAGDLDAKVAAPVESPAPKAAKGKKPKVEELPPEPEEEIVLLDAEGRRYCRVRECDQASAVDGYCRYHYLLYWKNIQVRKKILTEGKLERYIEELTARYPDKYLEMLKKDLRSEKEFLAAIQELEIDEASVDNEYEDEAQNYLDEVRGMSSETGSNDRDEEF